MTKPQFGAFAPDVLCTCALACVWATVFFAPAATAQSAENFTLSHSRLSPEVRIDTLPLPAPVALEARRIAPFLVRPQVLDSHALNAAARIVSAPDQRTLLSRGDRVHAISGSGTRLVLVPGQAQQFDIYRQATPLKDPISSAVLGFEAQYLGSASLVRGEGDKAAAATLEIRSAQEEIRVGDLVIASTAIAQTELIPRAFASQTPAHVVSVYASAVAHAAQNQVVVINRGSADGVEAGHVLAIQKRTQEATLPPERNGLALVLLPFAKVSYALLVQIEDSVRVGDVLTAP